MERGQGPDTRRDGAASERVVPVVLTLNEAPNLARTLESLRWARRVVVLDSCSTDGTQEIASRFSNVELFERHFDAHGAQWREGIRRAGDADYVLALDADMRVTPAFVRDVEECFLPGEYDGGEIPFEYRYMGFPLAGSVYPPQMRLFRPGAVTVTQPGHTQVFSVAGRRYTFKQRIIHDDRKGLERWVLAQVRYADLELQRLAEGGAPRRLKGRLRRLGVMPLLVGVLSYLRAGGPFRGAAAAGYAFERTAYECLFAVRLLRAKLREQHRDDPERER